MLRRRLDQTAFGFACPKHVSHTCLTWSSNTRVFHTNKVALAVGFKSECLVPQCHLDLFLSQQTCPELGDSDHFVDTTRRHLFGARHRLVLQNFSQIVIEPRLLSLSATTRWLPGGELRDPSSQHSPYRWRHPRQPLVNHRPALGGDVSPQRPPDGGKTLVVFQTCSPRFGHDANS